MTNIVMIASGRKELTNQAINTLQRRTNSNEYNLTLVLDGLDYRLPVEMENAVTLQISRSKGIVGLVRNIGIAFAEQYWGRGDYLYLSDNDVAFFRGWLQDMTETLAFCREAQNRVSGVGILQVLGGYQHPFHGTNFGITSRDGFVHCTDAVAGYSHLMTWETWDQYGPFDAHAKGVCQSEDFAFCQKIIKDGGQVGYIHPPVLANCGITNSEGKPAIGHEQFKRYPGLLYA